MVTRILLVCDGLFQPYADPYEMSDDLRAAVAVVHSSFAVRSGFKVDVAIRGRVAANSPRPRYRDFRFDSSDSAGRIIDRYHEIWCFADAPGHHIFPTPRDVDYFGLAPTTAELRALNSWMSVRRGGVFAAGLPYGASLCHQIPRVGSMYQWTGESEERAGFFVTTLGRPGIGSADDAQIIEPVVFGGAPHPVLQHPEFGTIDRMPRAHLERPVRQATEIALDRVNPYGGVGWSRELEYPRARDGTRPEPTVIAYGRPFGGGEPFPMISVYDGWPVAVGRIVVDSAADHWTDRYTAGLRRANSANWHKVRQYYWNVAEWLSPGGDAPTIPYPPR